MFNLPTSLPPDILFDVIKDRLALFDIFVCLMNPEKEDDRVRSKDKENEGERKINLLF